MSKPARTWPQRCQNCDMTMLLPGEGFGCCFCDMLLCSLCKCQIEGEICCAGCVCDFMRNTVRRAEKLFEEATAALNPIRPRITSESWTLLVALQYAVAKLIESLKKDGL